MFEQEIELEKRQSGAVPLLLILALIVAVVGIAVYSLIESRKTPTTLEATDLVINVLQAQAPPTVSFHVGLINERSDESAQDPRYRLLQKLNVLKVGKAKGSTTPVALTPTGSALLTQIAGVRQSKESNGTSLYVVPLAARRLVDVSQVTMTGTGRATVQFTWRWEPNALGEGFNARGASVGSFKGWERAALIDKHGAGFYHEAPPASTIAIVKTPQGWRVATD